MISSKPQVIFIVGPTASGKSDLAMQVAQEYGGEIICADSQTVRTGFDSGAAKPTKEDQDEVKHHLLDVVGPYDKFNVSDFKGLAAEAMVDIKSRGKLPVIAGGTGLYIDALYYDFKFRPMDSLERQRLEQMTVDELQSEIRQRSLPMPGNLQNRRHLVRTLESGGADQVKGDAMSGAVIVGLFPGRQKIIERINNRAERVAPGRLTIELESVIEQHGYPESKIDAIAYSIALHRRLGRGVYDMSRVEEDIKIAERQYAKRQMAWFKRNGDVQWFEGPESAFEYIKKLL